MIDLEGTTILGEVAINVYVTVEGAGVIINPSSGIWPKEARLGVYSVSAKAGNRAATSVCVNPIAARLTSRPKKLPSPAKNRNFGIPACRFCTFCTSDLTNVGNGANAVWSSA